MVYEPGPPSSWFGAPFHSQDRAQGVLPLKFSSDSVAIDFCVRLNALQEARNPAAHRQTYAGVETLSGIRSEAFALLGMINDAF